MPLCNLARTHLVYQSLILSLVLSIYHDFLPKIVIFLIVILYQILVLFFCCTEIVSVPRWMTFGLSAPNDRHDQSNNGVFSEVGVETRNNEVHPMAIELNNLDRCNQDLNACTRKYKLRNWKSPSSAAANLNQPTSVPLIDENNGSSLECIDLKQIKSHEATKKYFFPYRQKRLEQWIEPKENQRPYKIRNWQSNSSIGLRSAMSPLSDTNFTPTRNVPDSSGEKDDPHPKIPEFRNHLNIHRKPCITSTDADETENSKNCSSIDSSLADEFPVIPELLKRYTFPLRQKSSIKSSNDDLGNSDDYPSTPYWKTAGYSLAVKQEARKRRRSVSSSLMTSCKLDRDLESDTCRDFSQSVEIPRTSGYDSKFNSSTNASGSTTFEKMKLNIANCFSKIKRVNSKKNLHKGLGSKKRSFKSLFQSREKINLESDEKGIPIKSDFGNEKPDSGFYPSYIPFQRERFEKDVRKRMSELPHS